MISKSMVRRLQESNAYPRAVCEDCMKAAGGGDLPLDGSNWMATCDVCWEFRDVNNPIVAGHPDFALDAKHLERLSDN